MTTTARKHIALFNVAEAGHLNVGLGLTRKLTSQGHKVSCIVSAVAGDDALFALAQKGVEESGGVFINHYKLDGIDTEEAICAMNSLPLSPNVRVLACTMKLCTKATIDWVKANDVDMIIFGH